jgi:hypothetical protein
LAAEPGGATLAGKPLLAVICEIGEALPVKVGNQHLFGSNADLRLIRAFQKPVKV